MNSNKKYSFVDTKSISIYTIIDGECVLGDLRGNDLKYRIKSHPQRKYLYCEISGTINSNEDVFDIATRILKHSVKLRLRRIILDQRELTPATESLQPYGIAKKISDILPATEVYIASVCSKPNWAISMCLEVAFANSIHRFQHFRSINEAEHWIDNSCPMKKSRIDGKIHLHRGRTVANAS